MFVSGCKPETINSLFANPEVTFEQLGEVLDKV